MKWLSLQVTERIGVFVSIYCLLKKMPNQVGAMATFCLKELHHSVLVYLNFSWQVAVVKMMMQMLLLDISNVIDNAGTFCNAAYFSSIRCWKEELVCRPYSALLLVVGLKSVLWWYLHKGDQGLVCCAMHWAFLLILEGNNFLVQKLILFFGYLIT